MARLTINNEVCVLPTTTTTTAAVTTTTTTVALDCSYLVYSIDEVNFDITTTTTTLA